LSSSLNNCEKAVDLFGINCFLSIESLLLLNVNLNILKYWGPCVGLIIFASMKRVITFLYK